MSKDFANKLAELRGQTLDATQRERQVRSFAFGNLVIEEPGITKALIDDVASRMVESRGVARGRTT